MDMGNGMNTDTNKNTDMYKVHEHADKTSYREEALLNRRFKALGELLKPTELKH
jgi:hypothetical protein